MNKTVVSHFYNEEHLLPWWLTHHKRIFDHGIMIDYHSTDSSRTLINEICPTWEIVNTRNKYFDSVPIDLEVMDIERALTGWRMALNTTEFLYGNMDHLDNTDNSTQYFLGNYVFVDMLDGRGGPITLSHQAPLHEQRSWGYDDFKNNGHMRGDVMSRMNRSIHNYPIEYPAGRHFQGRDHSFDDLFVFYYGWADSSEQGLKRKTQIRNKVSEARSVHDHDKAFIKQSYAHLRQECAKDLTDTIKQIYLEHQRSTRDH